MLLIIGIGTFKEVHLRVAFKCQNMGGNAVEKPTVVRYYDGTTGKVFETLFECSQRIDVYIVSWLVEK